MTEEEELKMTPDQEPKEQLPRITGKHLADEAASVLNLERGILYTIVEFTLRPLQAFETYLTVNRRKFAHPLRFLFLTSAIAVFINLNYSMQIGDDGKIMTGAESTEQLEIGSFDFSSEMEKDDKAADKFKKSMAAIKVAMDTSFNWFTLLSVPFMALMTFLFFRNNYVYWEHFAAMCFLQSISNAMTIVIFPLLFVSGLAYTIGGLIPFAYVIIAIGQIFTKRKPMSYFKAFWVYALGIGVYFAIGVALLVWYVLGEVQA